MPVAEPPLDRAALLDAVTKAASATALGDNDAEQQRLLDGKRFEMKIRFGCKFAGEADGKRFAVTFDEENRALRIRAAPDLTMDDLDISKLAPDGVEAVEGFWLRRPWLLGARCPRPAPSSPEASEDDELNNTGRAVDTDGPQKAATGTELATARWGKVGIAQFFTGTDTRTGRRNQRAYELTKVLGANERPSPDGYNLVLSGRLRANGDRVIHCRSVSVAAPPNCVISSEIDRVWIEQSDSGTVLSEWSR
jgi:hypothetical protein